MDIRERTFPTHFLTKSLKNVIFYFCAFFHYLASQVSDFTPSWFFWGSFFAKKISIRKAQIKILGIVHDSLDLHSSFPRLLAPYLL